jgi:hypothetical protein
MYDFKESLKPFTLETNPTAYKVNTDFKESLKPITKNASIANNSIIRCMPNGTTRKIVCVKWTTTKIN